MRPAPIPASNDFQQNSTDAGFLVFRDFIIRLGFFTAAVPLLLVLLHWYLRILLPNMLATSLIGTMVMLAYPLATLTELPRKWLPWFLYCGTAGGMTAMLWGLSRVPNGYSTYLWTLLYPLFFVSLLSLPFRLRQNAIGVTLLLLVPYFYSWLGSAKDFPLVHYYVMVLPVVAVSTYFNVLVNRIANTNYAYLSQIEALANRDGLTNSFNRRYFMEEANRLLKLTWRARISSNLIMMDIDLFKRVNDRFGHGVGDIVIREAVRIFEPTLRETDLVARFGGEEFVAFLFDTDEEAARVASERVREAIEGCSVIVEGLEAPIRFTVSLGCSLARAGDSMDALLDRADKALYAAKEGGRNRVIVA